MQPIVGAPWFICDAVNAPTVLVVSRPDAAGQATILTIDKADRRPPTAALYTVGQAAQAGDSLVRPLTRDGDAAGHVRSLRPEALAAPGDATTEPVVEVKLSAASLECRWLPRTRLFGLVAGRTVLITEGRDGPVFRNFEFKRADAADPIRRGPAASTASSLIMRDGKVDGDSFTFANTGYGYLVTPRGISVTQDGAATVDEPFIAVQRGRAP